MKARSFTLKYGKDSVSFEIPEPRLLHEIRGKDYPPISDLRAAYLHALGHPIDAPPLSEIVKPGEKVLITVSDITRTWQRNDETLPILLEALNQAGIPDENVTILIVVGGHRLNTPDEFTEICGPEICHRVRVLNHDAWDSQNMVYLGKTSRGTEVSVNRLAVETDRLILTGGVVYHYNVGYGGGRKSILPGLASIKTIRRNHLHALGPELGSGSNPAAASKVLRGNAMHEDMMEIAAFLKPDFIVNVVPNLEGDIAGIFAGNWVSAFQDAARLVDDIFGVEIEAEADIVIATAGGYPRDINLYQTGKTIDNASYAMKNGGVAIILSECPDIKEPPDFLPWFDHPTLLEMERALRENFTIAGLVAFKQREATEKGPIILVTRRENAEVAARARFIPAADMEEALCIAYARCGTAEPGITIMPQGGNTLPIINR